MTEAIVQTLFDINARHAETAHPSRRWTLDEYEHRPIKHLAGEPAADPDRRCDPVLAEFDRIAATQEPVTYPPKTLLCIDPYDVHRAAFNPLDHPIERTFVKIAFSDHRYNREGNTPNPLLPVDWPMVPRDPGRRAHRWSQETP